MKKKRNQLGFTMAELLIVVAIITVLGGVGFVAVQNHQKNLAQTQVNTVAKEIFFAAQNHLIMAESQGYLSPDASISYGESEDAAKGIYYFVVNSSAAFTGSSVLDLMLPFGSIDETVRTRGNYVIRYQSNPARVLDVWYGRAENEDGGIKGRYTADPCGISISNLLSKEYNNQVIGHYGGDVALDSGVTLNAPYIEVVNAERLVVNIKTANVNLDANDKTILSGNDAVSVKLIITGETSDAMAAIPVLPDKNDARVVALTSGELYTNGFSHVVVLDDITTAYDSSARDGGRFANISADLANATKAQNTESGEGDGDKIAVSGTFIPGEDITVQAVAFSNSTLASITYSNEVTTNSLFAKVVAEKDEKMTGLSGYTDEKYKVAYISNIRHLENLARNISNVNTVSTDKIIFVGAKQTADLVWNGTADDNAFTAKIAAAKDSAANAVQVYVYQNSSQETTPAITCSQEGCFLPIKLDYALVYDGGILPGSTATVKDDTGKETTTTVEARYHSITGVKAQTTANDDPAGLFGTVGKENIAITIKNLELIDFDIKATGTGSAAGALAGKVTGASGANVKIENVLARNSTAAATATVTSSAVGAGGLIGEMTYCDVNKCAAALVVSGYTNAGGLVGASSGGSVLASYSGGHCIEKKVTDSLIGVGYDSAADKSNVTATAEDGDAYAGGLIGNAGGTHIESCYSTCSVKGKTAGGLIGIGNGVIKNNYAAGLVSGTNIGAFAGDLTGATGVTGCQYFEIINETVGATGASYLKPTPNKYAGDDETAAQADRLTGITRIDASVESYETFVGAPANWSAASAYLGKGTDAATDDWLDIYYSVGGASKYNLKGIPRMDGVSVTVEASVDTPADFVATHYGDWPAPEIFVINTPSNDSGAIDPTTPSP